MRNSYARCRSNGWRLRATFFQDFRVVFPPTAFAGRCHILPVSASHSRPVSAAAERTLRFRRGVRRGIPLESAVWRHSLWRHCIPMIVWNFGAKLIRERDRGVRNFEITGRAGTLPFTVRPIRSALVPPGGRPTSEFQSGNRFCARCHLNLANWFVWRYLFKWRHLGMYIIRQLRWCHLYALPVSRVAQSCPVVDDEWHLQSHWMRPVANSEMFYVYTGDFDYCPCPQHARSCHGNAT